MKKVIAGFLVLILIVSFSGCFERATPKEEKKEEKIESKEEASKTTAEVSEDIEGLSGSLKKLDEELG
jgi:uncharacterized lipoprotein YehR (DUF1307 family)